MCKALDYSKTIVEIYEKAKAEYREYFQELRNTEKEIVDVEHYIELENFNVVRGYFLAKKLKELKLKRHKIKNEIETLQSFLDEEESIYKMYKNIGYQHKGLENLKINKIYNPRRLKDDLTTVIHTN